MIERGGVYPDLPEVPPQATVMIETRLAPDKTVYEVIRSCSECNRVLRDNDAIYCPGCGRKFG